MSARPGSSRGGRSVSRRAGIGGIVGINIAIALLIAGGIAVGGALMDPPAKALVDFSGGVTDGAADASARASGQASSSAIARASVRGSTRRAAPRDEASPGEELSPEAALASVERVLERINRAAGRVELDPESMQRMAERLAQQAQQAAHQASELARRAAERQRELDRDRSGGGVLAGLRVLIVSPSFGSLDPERSAALRAELAALRTGGVELLGHTVAPPEDRGEAELERELLARALLVLEEAGGAETAAGPLLALVRERGAIDGILYIDVDPSAGEPRWMLAAGAAGSVAIEPTRPSGLLGDDRPELARLLTRAFTREDRSR